MLRNRLPGVRSSLDLGAPLITLSASIRERHGKHHHPEPRGRGEGPPAHPGGASRPLHGRRGAAHSARGRARAADAARIWPTSRRPVRQDGVELEPHPPVKVREPPRHRVVIVLDTNVISEAIKPSPDAQVIAWLRAQFLADMATTAVSLAEINYGLCRLPRGRRRDDLEDVCGPSSRVASAIASSAFDAPSAGVYERS